MVNEKLPKSRKGHAEITCVQTLRVLSEKKRSGSNQPRILGENAQSKHTHFLLRAMCFLHLGGKRVLCDSAKDGASRLHQAANGVKPRRLMLHFENEKTRVGLPKPFTVKH